MGAGRKKAYRKEEGGVKGCRDEGEGEGWRGSGKGW